MCVVRQTILLLWNLASTDATATGASSCCVSALFCDGAGVESDNGRHDKRHVSADVL